MGIAFANRVRILDKTYSDLDALRWLVQNVFFEIVQDRIGNFYYFFQIAEYVLDFKVFKLFCLKKWSKTFKNS